MKQHSWISFFVSRKQFLSFRFDNAVSFSKEFEASIFAIYKQLLVLEKEESSSFSQYDTRNLTNDVLNEYISRAASQSLGRVLAGPVIVNKSCLVDDRVFLSKFLIEGETTLSKTRWMFLQLKLLNIFLRR